MKLTINEKIGFGAGDMAIAIVMMSLAMIITYFYTDVFGLKPVDLGILLFSVRILDAVIDPVVGTMTDITNTRWGKYRPWLLFMSIPFGISIWLMFTTPDTDYSVKLLWAWATYVLLTLTYTLIAIPYVSLISVITDDPQERLSANGYRFVMTKIAMFAVTIIVPLSAMYLGKNNVQLGYQIAMGTMGILATCFWPGIWRDSLFPKVRYGAGRGLYRNRFSLSGLSTRRRTNTTGAVGDLPVNDDHSRDT